MPTATDRRRALRWALAGLAALIATWSGARTLSALRTADATEGRRITICVAPRDLLLGERTEASTCRTVPMRQGALPDDVVRDPARLADHIVRVPIVAGTPITQRHLARRTRDGADPLTPPGMRTVQVTVHDGFEPPPGSLVDVIAAFGPSSGAPTAQARAVIVARHALVVAGRSRTNSTTLQLVVTPDQAQRLALAQTSGTLSVAITPPEEATTALPSVQVGSAR